MVYQVLLAAQPLSRSEVLEMEQDTMPGAAAPGELPGKFMYMLTFRVRVATPAQYGRNGTASLQITSYSYTQ